MRLRVRKRRRVYDGVYVGEGGVTGGVLAQTWVGCYRRDPLHYSPPHHHPHLLLSIGW